MEAVDLVPRTIPPRAMMTTPHRDLRSDAGAFHNLVEAAASRYPAPGQPVDDEGFEALLQVQCYSRVVQVFALMVVEAALNSYGLLRFGPAALEQKMAARKRPIALEGPVSKLRILLGAVRGTPLVDSDEIVQIVDRLARRRNALVHPEALLFAPDATGTLEPVNTRRAGPLDVETARAAIADIDRFIELLVTYDPEVTNFFSLSASGLYPQQPEERQ